MEKTFKPNIFTPIASAMILIFLVSSFFYVIYYFSAHAQLPLVLYFAIGLFMGIVILSFIPIIKYSKTVRVEESGLNIGRDFIKWSNIYSMVFVNINVKANVLNYYSIQDTEGRIINFTDVQNKKELEDIVVKKADLELINEYGSYLAKFMNIGKDSMGKRWVKKGQPYRVKDFGDKIMSSFYLAFPM